MGAYERTAVNCHPALPGAYNNPLNAAVGVAVRHLQSSLSSKLYEKHPYITRIQKEFHTQLRLPGVDGALQAVNKDYHRFFVAYREAEIELCKYIFRHSPLFLRVSQSNTTSNWFARPDGVLFQGWVRVMHASIFSSVAAAVTLWCVILIRLRITPASLFRRWGMQQ